MKIKPDSNHDLKMLCGANENNGKERDPIV